MCAGALPYARHARKKGVREHYGGVRACVFGAGGFIGRWVTRALVAAGAEVCACVRDAARAAAVLDAGIARVVEVDALDSAAVAAVIARFRPAITFNLAGYGVDPGEREAAMAFKINVEAVEGLCAAVARHRAHDRPGCDVVHVGSALEYGRAGGDLVETTPITPFELYGRSKAAGTAAVATQARALGLHALTTRLFTVYGPGEHPHRLLPTLLAARGDAAPIRLSAGTQKRDFCYVEDVAEGLLRLGAAVPPEPGWIVNLASGVLTSVRTFTERAAGALGIDPARLAFGQVPLRAEEMEHGPVNVARLEALIGWRPAASIEDGVRRTAAAVDRRL
jgi:UDP-glucose 4-epimerase